MNHSLGQDTVVEVTSDEKPISWHVQQKINDREENAFVIGDLGDIIKKHKLWTRWFPRIEPFYAMKCNDIYPVIKLIADMGLSFDCASQCEIETVLQLGVDPSKIIFANPCKQKSFIRYAAKSDVMLMTFDNKDELLKIKQYHASSRLLLRIQPPAHFKVQLDHGKKFGCSLKHAHNLLQVARTLELDVVGVSFHVGSGCKELGVFRSAIFHAREIFNMGLNIGFHFDILDIGGGFPGDEKLNLKFEDIAEEVNISLDKHFPGDDVKIIAEPGHFYVASAFTIVTNIIARRVVDSYDQDDEYNDCGHDLDINGSNEIYMDKYIMYYVNDGIYGSFRDALITPDYVSPSILKEDPIGTLHASTIWGPTCDGLDCIIKECWLPTLEIGKWIYFKDMGAYTISTSSSFNGMPKPKQYFVCSRDQWKEVYPDDRQLPHC